MEKAAKQIRNKKQASNRRIVLMFYDFQSRFHVICIFKVSLKMRD